MSNYLYHGKLKAKAGNGKQLLSILLEASQLVAATKGCRLYLISKDTNEADAVWATEVWDSKEDHDNSLKLENVRALTMQAMPLLDGPPQKGQELEMQGGFGLK